MVVFIVSQVDRYGVWLGSVYFTFIHPLEGKIHMIPVFAVLVP